MTRPGVDLLGLAHPKFPFTDILRLTPKDTPIGFFWNQFGDVRPRFTKLMASGFTVFRIQMYWSDSHNLVPLNVLERGLTELSKLPLKPEHKLYISPSCEHAGSNASDVKQRLRMVQSMLPDAIPVNNPWKGHGAEVKGYLCEYHGSDPGECDLASTDGTNIYDIDSAKWVKAYSSKEHPCFLWGARFNLREIPDPGQEAPAIPLRTAAPSPQYYQAILRLASPMGTMPEANFPSEPFGKPNLWKTHAEDDQETHEATPDERRENRPVLIIKSNVPYVEILNVKGPVIGKLPRYGDYPGGLTRYYSGIPGGIGLYGYEIGNRAKTMSGCEWVWFRAGKQTIGPIHPAFRAGTFRSSQERR
jgi:hypothetical protein